MLDGLGISMGDKSDLKIGGTFENQVFMSSDRSAWQSEIHAMNRLHKYWGFKNPRAIEFVDEITPKLRNPHLFIVTRDPVAVAARWHSMGYQYDGTPLTTRRDYTRAATSYYSRIYNLINNVEIPSLVVSYERIKSAPSETIVSTCKWLGYKPTAEQALKSISRIRRDGGYVTI
jgi:hypothetical protein